MPRPKPDYFNQTTHRAMGLLEALASESGPISLADLARRVEASKSSVYPILRTLVTDGYVVVVGDGYQLTTKTGALAHPVADRARLVAEFFGQLHGNALASSETIILSVVSGRTAVVLAEHLADDRMVRLSVPVGTRLPLHASASGKVLISSWSTDAVHITLGSQQLPSLTARTTSNLATLLDELESVRRVGMAESWGELDAGVVSAAVAVDAGVGAPRAAVAVVAPIHRAEPGHWSTLKERLKAFAHQLKRAVG